MLNNKTHFLHSQVDLELYREGNFFVLMNDFGVPLIPSHETTEDNSIIDWEKIPNHEVFYYNYEGSEEEIKNRLRASELSKKEFVITYFNSSNEIVKVNTSQFIDNWDDFNFAVSFMGLIIMTNDGELILEFTDDRNYNLHSNFKIKSTEA